MSQLNSSKIFTEMAMTLNLTKFTFAPVCKICVYAKFAYMQIVLMCTDL